MSFNNNNNNNENEKRATSDDLQGSARTCPSQVGLQQGTLATGSASFRSWRIFHAHELLEGAAALLPSLIMLVLLFTSRTKP
mmetsp:Transcript_1750/g.3325  ORF Transcript_1750/g.3325 Transcript_1750/m.3325 type:complete len:82 (+) Transcript_1750:63-308(+)